MAIVMKYKDEEIRHFEKSILKIAGDNLRISPTAVCIGMKIKKRELEEIGFLEMYSNGEYMHFFLYYLKRIRLTVNDDFLMKTEKKNFSSVR